MAILTACTSNLGNTVNKNSVREAIRMSKKLFYSTIKNSVGTPATKKYNHKKASERKTYHKDNEEVCSRILSQQQSFLD